MIYHNDDFQPCAKRHRLIQVDRTGQKQPVFRCAEPQSEHYFDLVSPSMCIVCPVRKEVTRAAIAKKEYKPPLVEEIRSVKSRKVDDVKDSLWVPCLDRQVAEVPSCCGAMMQIKVCNSLDCFRMGSEVTKEMCRDCIHRKV